MLALKRNNTVWLCSVPLERDNNNQLTFIDKNNQANYFISKAVKVVNNVSYVREPVEGENIPYLRIESPIWKINNCNYVMYKNAESDKYNFAFVTRLEYKSDTVTYVWLEIDSFQTWQFDIEYKKSFIERQTPVKDYINTLADNVAVGQMVRKEVRQQKLNGGYFVFCSSDVTKDDTTDSRPFALKIGNYSIPCLTLYWRKDEGEKMALCLQRIAQRGWGDRILSAVYIPFVGDDVVKPLTVNTNTIGDINIVEEISPTILVTTVVFRFTPNEPLKAFTYPYSKIVVRDYATGQSIELAPDKFKTLGKCEFEIRGNISETPSYKIIPKDYEGQELAYNHALVINCNTSLPIINNLYAKYLMQNKDSNFLNRVSTIVNGSFSSGLNFAMGNPIGATQSLFNTFTNLASITNQENQARMLGNSVTSIKDDAIFRLTFSDGWDISLFTMDENHLETAKNYWKMLGYPVKSLAIPNINGNVNYNYVKLATPNIIGDKVPQDDLQRIKQMFLNGVTLWHNVNTFLDY